MEGYPRADINAILVTSDELIKADGFLFATLSSLFGCFVFVMLVVSAGKVDHSVFLELGMKRM